ncbi:hypothetical protein E4T56_gene6840 [Termitomyces sp. T112]|nr:hypothetical protein E4T56_gene6840 [Termitomyces sp. T112]
MEGTAPATPKGNRVATKHSTKTLNPGEYTWASEKPAIDSCMASCWAQPPRSHLHCALSHALSTLYSKSPAQHSTPSPAAHLLHVTTRPLNPRTSPINPPNPQKTPDASPNFRPCPAPILANSDASPANSDGPLANFGAFPAATDTYPGSPKPREPPPLFPIFATHHQLNTLIPPTYSGVSQQPQSDPRSPMIPSTYQHSPILDCNRHPPTPLSSAKPRRHSRRTPKFSGMTPSNHCAQVFINLNDLTNSTIMITNPDTPLPGPNLTLRSVLDSINSK